MSQPYPPIPVNQPLDLRGKRIAIIAHVFKYAEANDLLKYLQQCGADETAFIGLPLSYIEGRPGPEMRLFFGTRLVSSSSLRNRKLPGLIQYVRDLALAIYWILRSGRKWDLIVACDNLNAFSALLLRMLGRTKRVVYYTIDFVPERFPNKHLNDAYHALDKFALKRADVTWNVSDRIAEGRETVRGLRRQDYARQVTVPIGGWVQTFPRRPFPEIEKHSLVYSGGLLPHQGVQLVLDALTEVVNSVPDLTFYVTGMGPMENELNAQTERLGLQDHVQFLGYLESHEELQALLARCAVAVAMYSAELDIWSYYAEPAKIKLYLAAGLPVVTTSVTYIAEDLTRRQCGVVIPWEMRPLAEALIAMLTDEDRLSSFRDSALGFGSEFDWPVIFGRALGDPRLGLTG